MGTTTNKSADGVIKKREHHNISSTTTATGMSCTKISTKASSPKQHQLPLFLSKTYRMIDRCDTEIATWSSGGENFVVKDVEKFASIVLPLYFKHSNFSSFARQLNFYGFRKLRSDPYVIIIISFPFLLCCIFVSTYTNSATVVLRFFLPSLIFLLPLHSCRKHT